MSEAKRGEPNARIRFGVFAALVGALLVLYRLRPDWAQAVHWWPMALWTPVVLVPFLSLRPRTLWKVFGGSLVVWGAALHWVREPSGLIFLSVQAKAAGDYRVVSLNCAGGEVGAAREAFAQGADIVLLQEVGSRKEFEEAGKAAGYPAVSWSVDDAVFSRDRIDDPAKGIDFAAGTVSLGGVRLRVLALRLLPPVFRLDLYNPACWKNYASDAGMRRRRLGEMFGLAHLSGPCLLGGRFQCDQPSTRYGSPTGISGGGTGGGAQLARLRDERFSGGVDGPDLGLSRNSLDASVRSEDGELGPPNGFGGFQNRGGPVRKGRFLLTLWRFEGPKGETGLILYLLLRFNLSRTGRIVV